MTLRRKRARPDEGVLATPPAIRKCRNRILPALSYAAIFLIFYPSVQNVEGQFDSFEPSTAPCASNPSIIGYSTIAAINSDMDQELIRISEGGTPQESYFMTLCPQTTFDTSGGPLLPRLNQSTLSCGGTGNVNDECELSGGVENIRIRDPDIEGYSVNTMNFIGITFTAFTGWSVELAASSPTMAIFMNCLWQDFNAEGIARILNMEEGGSPMNLEMEMCTVKSSSGNVSSAVVNVAFENNGGSMQFFSMMVQSINVTTVFNTVENGATMVFDSAFTTNSMARLSGTTIGMSRFSKINVTDNINSVRIFEVAGEGSSTTIQTAAIERNLGSMAYQILLVSDGGVASLLNSTISFNIPVEYGVYVLAVTPGTSPSATIEDSIFQSNTQEDWALVMSEGEGANVVMARNQFIENTGGLMNIGAFFGGAIQFTQTCFERNNHFIVALILEFSTFVAFDNYVDEEVSQVCSGEGEEEGPGRLAVEQPGSLCFKGGDECLVDCLSNANDSPVCQARQAVGTLIPSPSPTESGPANTLAPTRFVSTTPTLSTPSTTNSPSAISAPQPIMPMPVFVPLVPTESPISVPSSPTVPPITRPTIARPTFRPPTPIGQPVASKPHYHRPPSHQPPTCQDEGKGHELSGSRKESKIRKSSSKKERSGKRSKSDGKGSSYVDDDGAYDDDDHYYGIGDHNDPLTGSAYHQQEEQDFFRGIGHAEPRTVTVEETGFSNNR